MVFDHLTISLVNSLFVVSDFRQADNDHWSLLDNAHASTIKDVFVPISEWRHHGHNRSMNKQQHKH